MKILKGYSQALNRRTDNTIVKRKKNNHRWRKYFTQKIKDRATRTPLKTGRIQVLRKS